MRLARLYSVGRSHLLGSIKGNASFRALHRLMRSSSEASAVSVSYSSTVRMITKSSSPGELWHRITKDHHAFSGSTCCQSLVPSFTSLPLLALQVTALCFLHPYSATHTAAIPMPVPTHMLVTPTFLSVLFNSYSNVETCRAPVQPNGCPNAIAPPAVIVSSVSCFEASVRCNHARPTHLWG